MARVVVTKRFTQWTNSFAKGVYAGLGDIGENIARETASSQPVKGYRIGGILSSARPGRTRRTGRGAEIEIEYGDFRGIFFERGTSRGVRGGRYLGKATRAAKKDALAIFRRHLK